MLPRPSPEGGGSTLVRGDGVRELDGERRCSRGARAEQPIGVARSEKWSTVGEVEHGRSSGARSEQWSTVGEVEHSRRSGAQSEQWSTVGAVEHGRSSGARLEQWSTAGAVEHGRRSGARSEQWSTVGAVEHGRGRLLVQASWQAARGRGPGALVPAGAVGCPRSMDSGGECVNGTTCPDSPSQFT